MSTPVILDELPDDYRRSLVNPAIAAARENPGKWVVYGVNGTRDTGRVTKSQLVRGRIKSFDPSVHDVEIRTPGDHETTVFIRYNGTQGSNA